MPPTLLAAIDLREDYSNATQGLDTQALSYIANVLVSVTDDTVDYALTRLPQLVGRLACHLGVAALTDVNDIISLLDAGATKVFVGRDQLDQLKALNIDQNRLVLWISSDPKTDIIQAIGGTQVDIYMHGVEDPELLEAWLHEYGTDRPDVFVSFKEPNIEHALKIAKLAAIPIIPAQNLTLERDASQKATLSVAKLFMASATSDRPDGLFTTLVTDERGTALGLVYSSEESVAESLRTGRGVYQSRKRGLWYKGESSGDIQELVSLSLDCDKDCLQFVVRQKGRGFCHLATPTCFGQYKGLSKLQKTLESRRQSAPEGSYTARLFNDSQLLRAKILEEANELCDAKTKEEIAFEAADLFYFALTKCVAAGVSLEDVERNLDAKSVKVKRRRGDAKPAFAAQVAGKENSNNTAVDSNAKESVKEAAGIPKSEQDPAGIRNGRIAMKRYITTQEAPETIAAVLQRPSQKSSDKIISICQPIIEAVKTRGDAALLEYTHKFEKATSLTSPVLLAPFPPELMQLAPETAKAIDISFENIRKFHTAQREDKPLRVETMPGVMCSRFVRPIERVGLYVPGGTAVLPSTALMLGVPAMVAGCKKIVLATPPRANGKVTPEVVYVAHKVGAEAIVLAGGAQAVAAMAYGTESVSKVDKILGPGNQFVTAAKMIVSNDTNAGVSIDMPAGPSEVLVIADASSNPKFVASDLLSQAEHGVDSQVILIAVGLTEAQLAAIEDELHQQANALPRVDIVRGAIEHSITLAVQTIEEAMQLSNQYAPEHLILQVENAEKVVDLVDNAGSIFVGQWTPESVGDYSAGVNHALRKFCPFFFPSISLASLG